MDGLAEDQIDDLGLPGRKGDRTHLPERPFGCFAQIGPVPLSARAELRGGDQRALELRRPLLQIEGQLPVGDRAEQRLDHVARRKEDHRDQGRRQDRDPARGRGCKEHVGQHRQGEGPDRLDHHHGPAGEHGGAFPCPAGRLEADQQPAVVVSHGLDHARLLFSNDALRDWPRTTRRPSAAAPRQRDTPKSPDRTGRPGRPNRPAPASPCRLKTPGPP